MDPQQWILSRDQEGQRHQTKQLRADNKLKQRTLLLKPTNLVLAEGSGVVVMG